MSKPQFVWDKFRYEFKRQLVKESILLTFFFQIALMATESLKSSGNKLGIKVRKYTSLFSKLWADLRRKTEFNQKRFYWWRYLSFRLNFGPCMLIKPSHFSEVAFCIKSRESPWTGIHLGERELKTINQKLARSPAVPCWVRRHLPLSGLTDF